MKTIEIKKNGHTIYKQVSDEWVEQENDIPQRDLTTTDCNTLALNIDKDTYDSIFKKTKPS